MRALNQTPSQFPRQLLRPARQGQGRALGRSTALLISLLLAACGEPATEIPPDAASPVDAASDAAVDAADAAVLDSARDAGLDAAVDATHDAGASDAALDAARDAASDAGRDVGIDDAAAGLDTGDPCHGLALCSVAGWSCDIDVLVTCLADTNGCLVETREDCTLQPGGYCSNEGVLAGCRQEEDPCAGLGTCPALTYCDGDTLRTCISDDQGCASIRGEQDCTNTGKVCDDSGADAVCVLANPSATSAQIQAVRDAIDAASSLPVMGDWDIDNALVTYVKAPAGADSGGFFIQGERQGPAIFVEHIDPVGIVEIGDEVSIWLEEADRDQLRRVVTGLGWLDIFSHGNSVAGWVQDVSAVNLVTELDGYEFELIELDATIMGPFAGAGAGFVDAVLISQGVALGTDLRLRVPTSLSTALLSGRQDLIGCGVSIGPTPLWRYLGRAQPSAFVEAEITINCM